MIKAGSAVALSAVLLCGSVFAGIPIAKKIKAHLPFGKNVAVKAPAKKVKVVNLGKPIDAVSVDTVLSSGRMSVVVGDGQFAEVLFQPFTRTRYKGGLVTPEVVPDGQHMIVWGKWDAHNPNVFKALAVSCREHLSEVAVRQKVALACQNITQGRTVASVPEPERHVVIMTAPAPTVTTPTVATPPIAVNPQSVPSPQAVTAQ